MVELSKPKQPIAADRAGPAEESSHCSRFEWVDPKVTEFIIVYRDSSSIGSFMDNHNMLQLDAAQDILVIDFCRSTDTICMGRSTSGGPFFFIYSSLFYDLHVALSFDHFTMGVLQALNFAPSQLHPNTWASL